MFQTNELKLTIFFQDFIVRQEEEGVEQPRVRVQFSEGRPPCNAGLPRHRQVRQESNLADRQGRRAEGQDRKGIQPSSSRQSYSVHPSSTR